MTQEQKQKIKQAFLKGFLEQCFELEKFPDMDDAFFEAYDTEEIAYKSGKEVAKELGE